MGAIKSPQFFQKIFKPLFKYLNNPNNFYDLSEEKLNLGNDNKTYWGNLGYWKDENNNTIKNYPQACAQLSKQLANAISLNEHDVLVDIGFGCGDQLFVWLEEYKIKKLYGINIASCQVALAQQRLSQSSNLFFKKHAQKIFVGGDKSILKNSHDIGSLLKEYNLIPNKIIAVDCAYHFQNKNDFLEQSYQGLSVNGMLGFSDLVFNRQTIGVFEKCLLRLICLCSRIPYQQLKTHQDYQQTLQQKGFEICVWSDISENVFIPFGDWLKAYIPKHPNNGSWIKYRLTAFFLACLFKRKLLAYIAIGLTKK